MADESAPSTTTDASGLTPNSYEGWNGVKDGLVKLVGDNAPSAFTDATKNFDSVLNGSYIGRDNSFGQPTYDFNRRRFPLDLGSDASYNGHYMIININVQESSKLKNFDDIRSTVLNNQLSKTDVLRFSLDAAQTRNSAYLDTAKWSRPRFTTRIAESIAIFMPSAQIDFTDSHRYEELALTSFVGPVARFISTGVAATLGGLVGGPVGAAGAAALAGSIYNSAAQNISNVARLGGTPINPKVEVLFGNTAQRQFRFDFLMSPSNQAESEAIKMIIKTLRFHAAPELRPGAVDSFFWIPPAEFDITFFHNDRENKNIPQINTCVLEQIDVSYAPSGIYSTFHNGHPVQIRMQLTFRETEVTHKLRVGQGF